MNLRIGDRVKFLNDVGGGIVKGFQENKFVNVETDDGFEMPVLASELMIDEAFVYDKEDRKTQTKQDTNQKEEKKKIVSKVDIEGMKFKPFKGETLLAIVPENEQLLHVSDFKLYLINDTSYSAQYVVFKSDGNNKTLIKSGKIEAETKITIARLSQTNLSKINSIGYQILFFKPGLLEIVQPISKEYSLEDVSFYKNQFFEKNSYFHEKALLLKNEDLKMEEVVSELSKSDVYKVIESKENKAEVKREKKKTTPGIKEVDLHIGEIVDNHAGMSNGEIITIQLDRFETALTTALNSGVQKIVFIHGVGNGRLKHELRKKLERKYPDLKYQDASFKEYGYGATMVYLK